MTRAVPLRVVIVHWNQVRSCLETVERFLDREVQVRVTVIDNGSDSAAVELLRSGLSSHDPSTVELIETGTNLGFGPGANVGLRRFLDRDDDGEWCVLAPHDVDPAPGCLASMLDAAANEPMAGLMCADVGDDMVPVIDPYFGGMAVPVSASPSPWPSPSSSSSPSPSPSPSSPSPSPDGDPPGPRWETVDYPHGTLMMLRRSCLTEIGVFDERYFSYCEEADLALRARACGWNVGLVRGAMVRNIHIGSGMAVVDYLQTRNTLLLVQEMSGWYHAFIRAWFTIVQTVRGVRRPATRSLIFDARARVMGVRDFVLRRFGPPPPELLRPPTQFEDL